MSQEIQALKEHVEARFAGLERWLERVTAAIEKQGENKERLIVVETKHQLLEERIASHERAVETKIDQLNSKVSAGNEKIIKFGVYFAVCGFVLTVIAPILLKKFLGV
ncbi:hypothetical protein FZ029_20560 [Azospirillum sp. Sh1]|nr:hypothetical protein FZ029_20560 [Azospirillum sp. Sh1]